MKVTISDVWYTVNWLSQFAQTWSQKIHWCAIAMKHRLHYLYLRQLIKGFFYNQLTQPKLGRFTSLTMWLKVLIKKSQLVIYNNNDNELNKISMCKSDSYSVICDQLRGGNKGFIPRPDSPKEPGSACLTLPYCRICRNNLDKKVLWHIVELSQTTAMCLRALVMATFIRLISPRNPTAPNVFDLTCRGHNKNHYQQSYWMF